MLETITLKFVDTALSVAKTLLTDKIKDANQRRLEGKRNAALTTKKRQMQNQMKVGEFHESIASLRLSEAELEAIQLTETETLDATLKFNRERTLAAIKSQVTAVKDWSEKVQFHDLPQAKKTSRIFVNLDTYLTPSNTHIDAVEKNERTELLKAVKASDRGSVILGPPGAGKTTSMKKLCLSFFTNASKMPGGFPILIRARDLREKRSPVISILSNLVRVEIKATGTRAVFDSENPETDWVPELSMSILNKLKPTLIIDGFDETPPDIGKRSVISDLKLMSSQMKDSKIVLTCRTGEFNTRIDGMEVYEIAPLTDKQIEQFSKKWIGKNAEDFRNGLKESPYSDVGVRPLILGHLCAIYQRTGSIPSRPKTVYRKTVGLLLEEWDEQRSVHRTSALADFGTDRKFEFLSALSYLLTTEVKTTVFDRSLIVELYEFLSANFGLPREMGPQVFNEIEEHTGLFLRSGYDRYEFPHKSIQEYLAAEYIVKLPSIDLLASDFDVLGSELAISTAISSNPTLYFSELVLRLLNNSAHSSEFFDAFVSRLFSEKPDFYSSETFCLAAYSVLDSYNLSPGNEILIARLLKFADPQYLLGHYKVQSRNERVMERTSNHPHFRLKPKLQIPIDREWERVLAVS